jgi:hypothetical protein
MPSVFVPPCIPTRAPKSPVGADWVHEIRHDGYRLQVRREGDVVRLFTRNGYDWSARYPAISVTATLLRARSKNSSQNRRPRALSVRTRVPALLGCGLGSEAPLTGACCRSSTSIFVAASRRQSRDV